MVLKVMLKEHPALSGELVPLLEALDADQVVDLTNIGVRAADGVRLRRALTGRVRGATSRRTTQCD